MFRRKIYAASCFFLSQDDGYVVAEDEQEAERKLSKLEDFYPLQDGDPSFDKATIHREMPTFLLRRRVLLAPEHLGENDLPNEVRLVSDDPEYAYAPLEGDAYTGLLVDENGKITYSSSLFPHDQWELIPEGPYPPHLSMVVLALQKRYARWEEHPLPCHFETEEVIYLMGIADALIDTHTLPLTEKDQAFLETLIAQIVRTRWKKMTIVEAEEQREG